MILPIVLFILFLFSLIRTGVALIWQERWLERKYHRIYTIGLRKYHIYRTLLSFFSALLLLLSMQYVYFPYLWGSVAIFLLVCSFFMLWIMTSASTQQIRDGFKHLESEQMPDEWRQQEQQKLHREMLPSLFLIGLLAISWCKTFPFVSLSIATFQEWVVSLLTWIAVGGWAIQQTMRDRRRPHNNPVAGQDGTN